MWNTENEIQFKALLKNYRDNPKQSPSTADIEILNRLFEAYIFAEATPYAEIPFYKEIIEFLNIFLRNALSTLGELDLKVFNEWCDSSSHKKHHLFKEYPILQALMSSAKTNYRTLSKTLTKQYRETLQPALSEFLTEYETRLLEPGIHGINHPYPTPGEPEHERPLALRPFREVVPTIYRRAQEKAKKRTEEISIDLTVVQNFVKNYYHSNRAWALVMLLNMYDFLDPLSLRHIPHLCHYIKGGNVLFVLNQPLSDILPNPAFQRIILLCFHRESHSPLRDSYLQVSPLQTLVPLVGKILVEGERPHPLFKGFSVQSKEAGKEPGFILSSPAKKLKYFVKSTMHTIPEYFCAKVISALGIKMPEAFLNIDEFGNILFATRDLSCTKPTKDGKGKVRKFSDFADLLIEKSPAAIGASYDKEPSEEVQAKALKEFLDQTFGAPAKCAFAKLLYVGLACGLDDLCVHTGNMGIIETRKGDKHYFKVGIVDFQFNPQETRVHDTKSFMDAASIVIERETMGGIIIGNITGTGGAEGRIMKKPPLFKKMFEQLTSADFEKARIELARPTVRYTSEDGVFLTQYPARRIPFTEILNKVLSEVLKELDDKLGDKLPSSEMEQIKKSLQENHKIMTNNLKVYTSLSFAPAHAPAVSERKVQASI